MVVISYKRIRELSVLHPDATEALNNWYLFAEEADWANFNAIRNMYGSVDSVGNNLYVFNVEVGITD